MREYSKRQAGEENTFENIRQDRGKNSQKLKQAKKLHQEAGISEGHVVWRRLNNSKII